jgi:hypothetical protein
MTIYVIGISDEEYHNSKHRKLYEYFFGCLEKHLNILDGILNTMFIIDIWTNYNRDNFLACLFLSSSCYYLNSEIYGVLLPFRYAFYAAGWL